MNVVGLDLSLTSSGICVISGQDVRLAHCGRKGKRNETWSQRSARISSLCEQVISYVEPGSYINVEGPSYGSVSSSTWDRAGLWHAVVGAALAKNCSIAVTPPVNAKLWLAGHTGAGKAFMIHCAREMSGLDITVDDEADAYALAMMACHKLGIIDEPDRVGALKGVAWEYAHTLTV